MHLHVAILPPQDVLSAVADVVRTADAAAGTAPAEAPVEAVSPPARRSLFGGRSKGAPAAAAPGPPPAPAGSAGRQLDHFPLDRMLLPIANFGNVTVADSKRISEALRAVAASMAAPTLHLAGSAALEFAGDQSVWAKVDGDVEALKRIPPAVTRSVEPLGFFVDRRLFRPMLSVATITDATTIEVLQDVVDALDAFRGEPWTVGHLSLMVRRLDHQTPTSKEIGRLPLGGR
jgi:2'-5' RNA ligase